MFERKLEEMEATVFVDDYSAEACSHNGIPLTPGPHHLSYVEAVALVLRMEHLFLSVPRYQQQRFYAMANQIRNAFGPEFWERHPDRMALDATAFKPRTRWA